MQWTDAQRRTWQRVLATCQQVRPMVDRLTRMAQYMPAYAEQIRELDVRESMLRMLAEIALSAESHE